MRIRALAIALLAASAAPLSAQDPAPPPGWVVRLDDPAATEPAVELAAMPPGWHVTAVPAAILYDPEHVGSGAYRVEAETYRFPGGLESGFGIILGMDFDGVVGLRIDGDVDLHVSRLDVTPLPTPEGG